MTSPTYRAAWFLAAAAWLTGCAGLAARRGEPSPGDATGKTRPALAGDQILTVDQLKPGMTGYGLTVFQGARPEKFDVEIISVLKNYDPQADMILVRCSGHDLEKTGIASGMSGSPIYINGKLIGALAYGWRFTIEPIAGIQPIEQMLRNSGLHTDLPPAAQDTVSRRTGSAQPGGGGAITIGLPFNRGAARRRTQDGINSRWAKADEGTRLWPLTTPLMVSGSSKLAMELLQRRLAGTGLVPLKSGSASANDPRLAEARIEPGGTFAAPLLSGDMDIAALGTITTVIGDRVLALGHPMFAEGPVNVPMATGIIHTFIPSMSSSFKIGSTGPVVGAVRRDESFSVLGVTGQKPYMAPMTVKVTSWDGSPAKTYRYRLVDDWYFSSMIAEYAAAASATADHGTPIDLTVHYRGRVRFKGFEEYTFNGVAVGGWGLYDMAGRIGYPIDAMLNNPWGKALVESVELEVRTVNAHNYANLERVRLEASTLAPGEPVVLHLTMRPYRKPRFETTLRIDLPDDLRDGTYQLHLADGDGYRGLISSHNPREFSPENMAELLAAFGRMAQPQDDRFYVVLTLPSGGLTTRDQKLPALPPSRALILLQANRYDLRPYVEDKVWPQPMGMVVSGSRGLQITIDRDKYKGN